MKEGKKGEHNPFENIPINKDKVKCDECRGELIKLETTLGETEVKGNTFFKPLYWVCICNKCNRTCKVFERKTKVNDYIVGKSNKKLHKLREL